ncbi:hypothetical protein Actkin_03034 [Actinokineospora sp. UTMC 2448]|nr:hypothetical protein Actkin_03034 [Actinokineospora sp. UTMC 2448]
MHVSNKSEGPNGVTPFDHRVDQRFSAGVVAEGGGQASGGGDEWWAGKGIAGCQRAVRAVVRRRRFGGYRRRPSRIPAERLARHPDIAERGAKPRFARCGAARGDGWLTGDRRAAAVCRAAPHPRQPRTLGASRVASGVTAFDGGGALTRRPAGQWRCGGCAGPWAALARSGNGPFSSAGPLGIGRPLGLGPPERRSARQRRSARSQSARAAVRTVAPVRSAPDRPGPRWPSPVAVTRAVMARSAAAAAPQRGPTRHRAHSAPSHSAPGPLGTGPLGTGPLGSGAPLARGSPLGTS